MSQRILKLGKRQLFLFKHQRFHGIQRIRHVGNAEALRAL